MAILILGVALWMAAHLFPAMGAERHAALVARHGEKPVKGAVSIALFIALGLIIWGWGLAGETPVQVWYPPSFLWHINNLLVLLAFLVFGTGAAQSNVARYVRHPQLTAVKAWALAHLLVNGDLRSIVLFGGMLVWAVLGVIFANRRDGPRVRPPAQPRRNDVKALGGGLALYVIVALAHPWLFGVSPFPG
jgi:uncharacterized membrane protein